MDQAEATDDDVREELADEVEDNEADELLKWARDLPEEVSGDFKASGSSFFKKGIV